METGKVYTRFNFRVVAWFICVAVVYPAAVLSAETYKNSVSVTEMTVKIVLTGTIINGNNRLAILKNGKDREKVYLIGEEIINNVILLDIKQRYVLISAGGKIEKLGFKLTSSIDDKILFDDKDQQKNNENYVSNLVTAQYLRIHNTNIVLPIHKNDIQDRVSASSVAPAEKKINKNDPLTSGQATHTQHYDNRVVFPIADNSMNNVRLYGNDKVENVSVENSNSENISPGSTEEAKSNKSNVLPVLPL